MGYFWNSGNELGPVTGTLIIFMLLHTIKGAQLKVLVSMLYMTVFCAISPVGVGVGMALKQSGEVGK